MENVEAVICLDTGVVIDILRKKEQIVRWLASVQQERLLAITLITLFEIYRGVYQGKRIHEELEAVEYLKKQLTILPLTEQHMQEAASESIRLQRNGKKIDIRDIFIGICAREEGCMLKTNNRKHFTDIRGLQLVD